LDIFLGGHLLIQSCIATEDSGLTSSSGVHTLPLRLRPPGDGVGNAELPTNTVARFSHCASRSTALSLTLGRSAGMLDEVMDRLLRWPKC
jgi:hypothetical protein